MYILLYTFCTPSVHLLYTVCAAIRRRCPRIARRWMGVQERERILFGRKVQGRAGESSPRTDPSEPCYQAQRHFGLPAPPEQQRRRASGHGRLAAPGYQVVQLYACQSDRAVCGLQATKTCSTRSATGTGCRPRQLDSSESRASTAARGTRRSRINGRGTEPALSQRDATCASIRRSVCLIKCSATVIHGRQAPDPGGWMPLFSRRAAGIVLEAPTMFRSTCRRGPSNSGYCMALRVEGCVQENDLLVSCVIFRVIDPRPRDVTN